MVFGPAGVYVLVIIASDLLGRAAWTQPNLGFQRWFSASREAAKRAFQPLGAAATLQVRDAALGWLLATHTSHQFPFPFDGLLNPSNLLIIWENTSKNHPKTEDLQKTPLNNSDQKGDGCFKTWQNVSCTMWKPPATCQVYGQDAAQEKIHCDVAGAKHRMAYSWGSEGCEPGPWDSGGGAKLGYTLHWVVATQFFFHPENWGNASCAVVTTILTIFDPWGVCPFFLHLVHLRFSCFPVPSSRGAKWFRLQGVNSPSLRV